MHDPTAIFRFEEHDVFLPMMVLEELDAAKKGLSEVARNVRQVSRFIGEMMQRQHATRLDQGLDLREPDGLELQAGTGCLFFQTTMTEMHSSLLRDGSFADNEILSTALSLQKSDGWFANQCAAIGEENGVEALVKEVTSDKVVLRLVDDYYASRNSVWGIHARNREQNFALNLLMDPEIDFVTLMGTAGTGKALLTRASPGTKMVCLGNVEQIDTPYLTETTSGLTFAVDRFKQWDHAGHITLKRGERSRLADFASEVL